MFDKLTKKVEFLAHLATIAIAILLGIAVTQQYFARTPAATNGMRYPEPSQYAQVRAGAKLSVADVDWGKNDRTLLLTLSQGCHYCSASAPFYRRLTQETAGRKDVGLVAVLPQPVEDGRSYLSGLGVEVADVRQAPLDSLGVVGTPTLILVNKQGVVIDSWRGQLPPFKEEEVLNQLRCGKTQPCG